MLSSSNILAFKYPTKEDTEQPIDKIFKYMDDKKIDVSDYQFRRTTTTKESGLSESVLYLTLGIKIRNRENIKEEIRNLLK